MPICASVAREQEPASTAAWPDNRGSAAGIAAFRQHAGAAEIRRQAHRDAGTAGDQRVVFGRLADRDQMRVAHRIDDGVAAALLLQRGHRLADRHGALLDRWR